MLGVDPTQSYGENTKSPIQDFHRFCYKNLLKIDFFKIISHNYLLFWHIVWFYNIFMTLNWNSEKNLENVFIKIFSFYQWMITMMKDSNEQYRGGIQKLLHISCHNLAELWLRKKICSPKYPSKIPLKVSRMMKHMKILVVWEIFAKISGEGSKWSSLGCLRWSKELGISRVNKPRGFTIQVLVMPKTDKIRDFCLFPFNSFLGELSCIHSWHQVLNEYNTKKSVWGSVH